ncbi:MAG: RNA polymerase subunit sigma-70, partial [Kofleriaceae bacterium]|nr:RNA polymerase subunit sigma-70 [Kofleriaceae bacterium]
DKYGVSRERARQLEKRMLDRLRNFLESELGSAVDIGAMSRD